MDHYTLPRPSAGSWIPQPDQSGYPPLRRSMHTVDLAVPPRQSPIPDINERDPDNCHDTLRDHRRAIKGRYRRIVENQMRAEEAPHAEEGLRPFRWDACEWNQPLLPELKRAMDESGRDAARAWERFDRRSSEDKVAAEVAKRERVAEVQRRVEDMMREEKERKEDEGLRELLEEIPIYRYPEMNNSIPLTSLIGNIQEQINAPICDILITKRNYPYIQLELSQILGWVQQDCSQHDLERVVLVSSDELDRYCCLIADRIFHHTSSGFKKHNYLPRLRNAQARLRTQKKVNTDLTEENKKLQSMIEASGQSEPDWNTNSYFDPNPQRLVRPQQPLTSNIPPNFSSKQMYPHSLYRSTNEDEMTPERRRVGTRFDTNNNNHEGINQEYQHSQRNQSYQVNNAAFSNDADMAMGFRASQANGEPQAQPPMQGGFCNAQDESEEFQSPQHHGRSRNPAYTNRTRAKKVLARKSRAMARFKRSRNKPEMIQESLPEMDPITGYGTVVGVDEVGPIYDYSNIERVTMRGGAGPYAGLEDSDDEDDCDVRDDASNAHSSVSTHSKAPPRLGNGVMNKIKRFTGEDDSDAETSHGYEQGSAASIHSSAHSHSSLKFTKHGDTVTNDPNNYLWGGQPVSSSASGSSNVSQVNSTRPTRHDYYGQRGHRGNRGNPGRRKRNNSGMIAPGLMPMAPREDPYAQGPQGYTFAMNQPDSLPLTPTWTTIDPRTGEVTYEDGGREAPEAQNQEDFSWNPSHPRNTPLAATFGTANVVLAPAIRDSATSDPAGLTAKSLEKLDKQQRHRERRDSISSYIDITGSPPGSPNASPSEPSVVANSLKRGYDSISKQGENSLFIDDEVSDKAAELIHPDVKENFIQNIYAAHDARPALSDFEKRNKEWLSQNKNPVSYINEYSEGNRVEVSMKAENRTRSMNERGEYVGKDLGQVKKRYLRGYFEMIEAREKEMMHASKVYREFKEMSIEERMKRLTLIRQPVHLWNGRPGAHPDDEHEVSDLPAIYKRRVEDRNRKRRMRAIAAEKAKQNRQNNSTNASVHSIGTLDTLDTEGRLGDCDGLPMGNTTSGSSTPQQGDDSSRTPSQLDAMLRRALDVNLTDGSSRRSIPSNSSNQVNPRSESRDRPFSGGRNSNWKESLLSGSGYSISGPRPSAPSSVARSNLSPMPSQGAWSPIVSRNNHTPRPGSPVSDVASTVKALRNAPLGNRIYIGRDNDRSSGGTNAADDFAALLDCDDSPLLMEPEDTHILYGPITGLAAKLYAASIERAQIRGRVVTVRLHTLPNGMPKFTPSAIASRVFGGLVQEFQLHPDSRTAVVVFIHPNEARAYVQHFRNVREKGTEQEIRELQVEVSWYKGKESESIIAHQPNLLKHNLAPRARRCILLSHIPITKKYQTVSEELSSRLGKLLLNIYFITPTQNYLKVSEGRQVMLEFASLADAVDAYDALKTGRVSGYEDSEPEYKTEATAKRWSEKPYCGCLGCCEKREEREEKKLTDEERMRRRARRREERAREAREAWEVGGGENVDDEVRSMSWGLGDDDDESLVLSSVYDSESS